MKRVTIPREVFHPLFFYSNEVFIQEGQEKTVPFWEDILFYEAGLLTLPKPNSKFQELFSEWKVNGGEIQAFFRQRKRTAAKEPMIFQLSRLIQSIFWANGQVVQGMYDWKRAAGSLEKLPVNAIERISFIFEQPDHYQSFIQLHALFQEWEKSCSTYIKKKSL